MSTKTDTEFYAPMETAENCLEFYQTDDWFELIASENYERETEAKIFELRDSVKNSFANGEIDIEEEDAENLVHLLEGLEVAANQFWEHRNVWDGHLESMSNQIQQIESSGFYISDEATDLSETIDGYLESVRSETKKKQHIARRENLADFFAPLRELNHWLKSVNMPRADFGTLTMLYYGVHSHELTEEYHHLKSAGLAAFRTVSDGEPEVLQKVLDKMKTLCEDAEVSLQKKREYSLSRR